MRHAAEPGVPRGVSEPVAEAGEDEGDDEQGVGRVDRDDHIGRQVTDGAEEADAALAHRAVDVVVHEGRHRVAHKRGHEEQRHDQVGETVVLLNL